jgi:hypothetical protein
MNGINWAKLVTAVTAMLCVTVLMGTNHLDPVAGVPVITLVIGYMLGNGVAARNGDPVQPMLFRRPGAIAPSPVGQWTSPDGTVWVRDVLDGPWRKAEPADRGAIRCGALLGALVAVILYAAATLLVWRL